MTALRSSLILALALAAGITGYAIGSGSASAARAADAPAASAALPGDVFADSRSRVPLAKREQLDQLGQQMYDQTAGDKRSLVGLQGPGGIRLYSPKLDEYTRAANQYLRFNAGLDRRLSELAILATAREMNQHFEWYAHDIAGRAEGLEPAIIDVVRYRRATTGLGEKEATMIELVREAVGKHKVSSATFATAKRLFGLEPLVNYIGLVGDYAGTGILLTTFDQQLPEGKTSQLPPS